MLTLNEIHQGDCLELMQDIPSGSVDMILCDLPYGTTACKWDTIIPFDKLWAQYERVIKPNGAIVLTAAMPFTAALVISNTRMFKYCWYWNKVKPSGFLNAKNAPLKKIEEVCVFSFGTIANRSPSLMNYYPQGLKACTAGIIKNGKRPADSTTGNRPSRTGEYQQSFTGYPISLIEFAFEPKPQHPTQKPVALFEYLIRTYTHPGEVVLDNCAGSFTTAVAAENTGRLWICIEQEAKYCEIGRARLAARKPQLQLV